MVLLRTTEAMPRRDGVVVTVGSFDGVHYGHRALLSRLSEVARQIDGTSVVVTFEPHPRLVLEANSNLKLLSSLSEKEYLLNDLGIDYLVALPFDAQMASMSWSDFVREQLVHRLGASHLVVGYNHHFGRNKEGSYDSLSAMKGELGIEVHIQPREDFDHHKVSSTILRDIISRGDMTLATEYLTTPYIALGKLLDGTMSLWQHKQLPPPGEYRVAVESCGSIVQTTANVASNTICLSAQLPNGEALVRFG